MSSGPRPRPATRPVRVDAEGRIFLEDGEQVVIPGLEPDRVFPLGISGLPEQSTSHLGEVRSTCPTRLLAVPFSPPCEQGEH